MSKIPPSNLGPMSQPWADWITARTTENREAIRRLGGDVSNEGRIGNSQMDVLASQINEIHQRQSGFVTIGNFSTGSFSTGSRSANRTFNVPPPQDARRIGWLSAQVTVSTSNTNAYTGVEITMTQGGATFLMEAMEVPQLAGPSGQNLASSGFLSLTANPGQSIQVGLNTVAFAQDFDGTPSRNITYSRVSLTYQWGQRV